VEYGRAFLAGLRAQGVVGWRQAIFPGLGGGTPGFASRDSGDTAGVARALESGIFVPYRELAGELPMIMITHACLS